MATFSSTLRQFSRLGVTSELSVSEAKRVTFTNWILLTAFLISLPHTITYGMEGKRAELLLQIATNTAFLVGILVNARGAHLAARYLALGIMYLNTAIMASRLGMGSGEHLALIPITLSSFLMFGNRQRKHLAVILGILILSIVFILASSNSNADLIPWQIVPSDYQMSLIICLMGTIATAYYFKILSTDELKQVRDEATSDIKEVFNHSNDAMILLDSDSGTILDHNPAASVLFRREDLIDAKIPLGKLLPASERQNWGNLLDLPPGDRPSVEFLLWELPLPVWVQAMAYPIMTGQGGRTVVRFVDISTQKEYQNALIKARHHAEEAAKAKASFLANMSHELRTPMNAVIGMTDLLKDTPLDEDQSQMVEVVHQSGESLLSLINDILDFSKLEAEKIELHPRSFSVAKLLRTGIDQVAYKAREKNLDIHLFMADDVPKTIVADDYRIQQVLLNFLSNATKFTAEGAIEVSISNDNTPSKLRVFVRDTGIGIEPDKVEAIFQHFNQVDTSITRKYGGTGLGLAISKRLVSLMGGDIQVESTPGVGSTFSFSFFYEPEPAQPAETPPNKASAASLPGAGLRVLVAEDQIVNQKVIKRILNKLGANAQIVGNGALALEAATANSYDLILMDISMPTMDGLEATRRIIQKLGRNAPPIVALTANVTPEDHQNALNSGMSEFLTKPLNLKTLEDYLTAHKERNGPVK